MSAEDDNAQGGDDTLTSPVDLEKWAPAGEPTLELLVPERRLIPVPPGSILVGREPGPKGIALDYPGISREHAQLTRSLGRSTSIMDLESKNGTVVNGSVVRVRNLQEGDRIVLGSEVELRFTFCVVAKAPAVLTPREREVTSLVAAGLTNKEIAARLGVTRHAIDAVLRSAFKRAGVRTRAALVAWFGSSA